MDQKGSQVNDPKQVQEELPNGREKDEKEIEEKNVENAQVEGEKKEPNEGEVESFQIFVKPCTGDKKNIPLTVTLMDNIQDIKQYLYEAIETCFVTNYHLFLNGNQLNDFSELSEIQGIKPECVLQMKEAPYDERSIKLHVRRLKEILTSDANANLETLFSQIYQENPKESKENGSHIVSEEEIEQQSESLLGKFFPPTSSNEKSKFRCLKNLSFSGWNPPPPSRRLMGDLIYLEVTTLENKTFQITGWNKGFYVSKSTPTYFQPELTEKSAKSHSLVGLLNQLSPLFKKEFQHLLSTNFQKHPFEIYPVPYPVNPWLGKPKKHQYDPTRSEDAVLFSSEAELRGHLRDWNEEYQSCKELPHETIQDRIIRDRALVKVNCDFVEAATKGAIAIVEKTVTPINPLDPERAHMYIYNNIFFSYAMDGRDFYKEYGGDRAAYVSVNNDLKGIRAFNQADIDGLYTLATAVIDYRGHRLVAQSIIPGILQREQTSNVIYGSIDNGKKIASDSNFHELMLKAGKRLLIKENSVYDSEDNLSTLCSPVESKGIVGTDGRRYILDLIRITPRDANYEGKQHMLTILRPELVFGYYEYLKRQHKLEKEREKQKEKEKKQVEDSKKAEEKKEETNDQATDKQQQTEKAEEKKEQEPSSEEKQQAQEEEEEDEDDDYEPFTGINPNVFCDFKFGNPEDEIKEDEKLVKQISDFLVQVMIPQMVEEFSWFISVPVDGQSLTTAMHSRGINMRYLGRVCQLAEHIPIVKEITVREMITRAAKHILRANLQTTEDNELAQTISHFLNCFLSVSGENIAKAKKSSSKKKRKSNRVVPSSGLLLTTTLLWDQICDEVKDRFDYDLPSRADVADIIGCVSTLRSICQKVGIQIKAKDYNFKADSPVVPEDILNMFPISKHTNPETDEGRNLLEAGKSFLNQGRLDIAYELLTEALAILHQVYGPMHKDTASCYTNLAMVLYHAKDANQALDHQQKACIINERVLGLDHPDTNQSYSHLSLFSHNSGKTQQALAAIKHALYLTRLVCGPNHPDIPNTYTSVAMMLQEMGKNEDAMAYLKQAAKYYEKIFGSNHPQTATIYHGIAVAYSQLGEFRQALQYEKKNYEILVQRKVPENDVRLIESNLCLKQFTAKAVQRQMESKKTQQNITSQISKGKISQLKNLQQDPNIVNSNNSNPNSVPMGSRSLNDILKFINGKSPSSSSGTFLERNQSRRKRK